MNAEKCKEGSFIIHNFHHIIFPWSNQGGGVEEQDEAAWQILEVLQCYAGNKLQRSRRSWAQYWKFLNKLD
jgi:hypothetical protein